MGKHARARVAHLMDADDAHGVAMAGCQCYEAFAQEFLQMDGFKLAERLIPEKLRAMGFGEEFIRSLMVLRKTLQNAGLVPVQ